MWLVFFPAGFETKWVNHFKKFRPELLNLVVYRCVVNAGIIGIMTLLLKALTFFRNPGGQ